MDGMGLTRRESYSSSLYAIEEFSILGSRKKQEDGTGCSIDGNTSVMVLCDGIGGLERGDLAAKAAVESILWQASEYEWKENPVSFLDYLIQKANESVFSLCDESGRAIQGGCTLVLALAVGRKVYIASVGDSRAYIIRRTGIRQLTPEHTFAEQLRRRIMAGEIMREEYDKEIARGAALTSYLGMGKLQECFLCSGPLVLDRDEVILLESDGLHKVVSDADIFRIIEGKLRCLDEAGEELLSMVQNQKNRFTDNTSIILFRIK